MSINKNSECEARMTEKVDEDVQLNHIFRLLNNKYQCLEEKFMSIQKENDELKKIINDHISMCKCNCKADKKAGMTQVTTSTSNDYVLQPVTNIIFQVWSDKWHKK